MLLPESLKKLTEQLTKLPGVGPRQAARFAFHILNSPQQAKTELVEALQNIRTLKLCPQCNFPSSDTYCTICADKTRHNNILAVVERATDLLSLERAGQYRGLYFILGGNIYTNKNLSVGPLKKRVAKMLETHQAETTEIILATNPTTEGEATALFIEKEIQDLGVKISRLGRGLPSGADLEYADAPTLQQALESRKTNKS